MPMHAVFPQVRRVSLVLLVFFWCIVVSLRRSAAGFAEAKPMPALPAQYNPLLKRQIPYFQYHSSDPSPAAPQAERPGPYRPNSGGKDDPSTGKPSGRKDKPKKGKGRQAQVSTAPAGSERGGSDTWSHDILRAHNEYRAKYGAKPLEWSAELEGRAKDWAQACTWKHNSAGQNLDSAASSDGRASLSGEQVVRDWVEGPGEISAYNPSNPEGSHFTQVVWKSTTHVGCHAVSCNLAIYPSDMWPARYVVCQYSPAGNVKLQSADGDSGKLYRANVQV